MRLRLLTDSIGKDIEKSVKKSGLQNIDVKVDADTLSADAKLALTKKEADELDAKNPKVTPRVDTKDAQKQTHLLRDALILLGPTVGPLTGAAAAAFGGVAAGAGVAVLAVLGVKKEMKAATVTGVAFSGGLATLKGDLAALEATAAKGVLPGFQQTVSALHTSLPGVNDTVNVLSHTLGDLSGRVVVGLVGGLKTFEPLLIHVASLADTAAMRFEAWATGPGGAKFAQAIGRDFDRVVPVIVHLAEAFGKVVQAAGPLGGATLTVLNDLATVIDKIPTPVLTVLATGITAVVIASRGARAISALTESLNGLTKPGSVGGFVALAATAAAVTYSFARMLDHGKDLTDLLGKSAESAQTFEQALIQSNGALDQNVRSTITAGLQQSGLADQFKAAGVNLGDLTAVVSSSDAQWRKFVDTQDKNNKVNTTALFSLGKTRTQFQLAQQAAKDYQAALDAQVKSPTWAALKTNGDSVTQIADKFHIAADSVGSYAALVGISSAAIKSGVVTNQQLSNSVLTVKGAYDTASAAGAVFLDALQKFSTSAGTAADRAQLIGAYLKAAQGDMLGFQGAVASTYQANRALTDSFKQQTDQVKAGSLALNDTERAAINLKTGMIDVTRAGAGPLIQQLQAMQDAAMGAAEATYQHEVATKGAGQAAADAAKIFQTQTFTALVNDAKQLGLTTGQAERLAKSYFALPKDIATRVRALGTDPVVNVLNQIGKQLAYLTGHPWVSTVNANTRPARANISGVNDALHGLHGKTVTVGANTGPAENALAALNYRIESSHPIITPVLGGTAHGKLAQAATGGLIQYRATGGPSGRVVGPGSGTSDTAGLFALSNGEYVVNANSTKQYLPLLKAINSGGLAGGGIAATGGGVSTATILAAIQTLAAALADRPVRLEANGQVMAKVVNDANLRNARRVGQ